MTCETSTIGSVLPPNPTGTGLGLGDSVKKFLTGLLSREMESPRPEALWPRDAPRECIVALALVGRVLSLIDSRTDMGEWGEACAGE